MARIRVEEVVDHLESEFRKALKNSVRDVIPGADFNERELYRKFQRHIGRQCSTWERVPDRYVESD